eukprot:CAMPEP_0198226162 /NCGR_PEP_ID=MMETSP1445-20131203/104170_1 /TAXON_ID=36898 /ORGANISM="Pyramimonas sp., Strain CCMP2087" /LENGTH=94 /DNA_ID=CAMNT_0043905905 /DNA_START=222 /DNA_END=506 /DNA_ORIENTATION=+
MDVPHRKKGVMRASVPRRVAASSVLAELLVGVGSQDSASSAQVSGTNTHDMSMPVPTHSTSPEGALSPTLGFSSGEEEDVEEELEEEGEEEHTT